MAESVIKSLHWKEFKIPIAATFIDFSTCAYAYEAATSWRAGVIHNRTTKAFYPP